VVAVVSVLASLLSFPAAAPAAAGGVGTRDDQENRHELSTSMEGFVYRHAS
jgi:hypothetical protein